MTDDRLQDDEDELTVADALESVEADTAKTILDLMSFFVDIDQVRYTDDPGKVRFDSQACGHVVRELIKTRDAG